MAQQDEVRVAWGSGIAGYVAESGEPVNIPDAYQVCTSKQIIFILVENGKRASKWAIEAVTDSRMIERHTPINIETQ